MNISNEKVIEKLLGVINKFIFLKKERLFTFGGVDFYPSEIHLMLAIKDGCSENATRIAEKLGITKGAVWQTLKRLEKKSVILKTKDPYNKNELRLTFTKFGNDALKHYKGVKKNLELIHDNYLKKYSEKEKYVIYRFLEDLDKIEI